MNVQSLINPITKFAGASLLKVKKYAPEMMLVSGVGCVVVGTVKACSNAPKASVIMDEFNEKKKEIKEVFTSDEYAAIREEKGYNTFSYRRDMAELYFNYGIKVLSVYWKPLVLGASGIALIFGAHGILKNRITGLTAAYATLDDSFKKYRKRVVDELGADKDREFKTGIKKIGEAAVGIIDPETGELKKELEKADIEAIDNHNMDDFSDYGRWFTKETTTQWDKSPEYNLAFLKGQETVFNNLLHSRGYVFLNEVYHELGFRATPAGAVVGWVDDGNGDGFIDFGISGNLYSESDKYNSKKKVYTSNNGYYLDFNVDGVMWDKI